MQLEHLVERKVAIYIRLLSVVESRWYTIAIFTFPSRKKGEHDYRLGFPELNEMACDAAP